MEYEDSDLVAANLRLGNTAKAELLNKLIAARPSVRLSDRTLPAAVIVGNVSETENFETKDILGAAIGSVAVFVASVVVTIISRKTVAGCGGNRANYRLGDAAKTELLDNLVVARPSGRLASIALPAAVIIGNVRRAKGLAAKDATGAALGGIAISVAGVVIVIVGGKTGARNGGSRADHGLGNTAAQELLDNVIGARPSGGLASIALPAVVVVGNIIETKKLKTKNAFGTAVSSVTVSVTGVIIVVVGRKTGGGNDRKEGCHGGGNQESIDQSNKFHGLREVRMLRLQRWVEEKLTELR